VIRIPYRWTRRTVFRNISYAWSCITDGIRNLRRWVPIIWWDADCDWDFLATVMEFKFRAMSKRAADARIVISWRATERQCLVCAELLKRLSEDRYWENAQKRFGNASLAAKHAELVRQNDKGYLGVLIGKYLDHWWD
jgi:hypothetical protein